MVVCFYGVGSDNNCLLHASNYFKRQRITIVRLFEVYVHKETSFTTVIVSFENDSTICSGTKLRRTLLQTEIYKSVTDMFGRTEIQAMCDVECRQH